MTDETFRLMRENDKLTKRIKELMTNTKFQDEFSEEIWRSTYKDHNDENIDDTFRRVAKYVASVEETPTLRAKWELNFYTALTNFKITAGGRIYSNSGTEWAEKGTGLLNCYVAPRKNKDIDSLNNILSTVIDQSNTLKSEGGWGENFSYIRPRGGFIHGVGVETPGAVKYMEIFDKTSDVITSGSGRKSKNKKAKGKIRKGAMMGVLDVWHPDIFEFITAKQNAGRLTKFNMSVNCTNEFMARVLEVEENGCDEFDTVDVWELKFPDTTFEHYKEEWDGDLELWESKGYPTIVYDTVSVKHLWNIIMESTYNRAEPGILWCDRANEFNPAYYIEKIRATNPCTSGDTKILTRNGFKEIQHTIGQKIDVWNGYEFSEVEPKITGKNQEMLNVSFSDGSNLKCTKYHKFVLNNDIRIEAQNLSIGDKLERFGFPVIDGEKSLPEKEAYTMGFYSGDGSSGQKSEIWLYGKKMELFEYFDSSSHFWFDSTRGDRGQFFVNEKYKDNKFIVPSCEYDIQSRLNWLAGIIDSDGANNDKGGSVTVTSIDKDFLMNIKYMIQTLGESCVVSVMKKACTKLMPDGKGGKKEYYCQESYRLVLKASTVKSLRELGLNTHRVDVNLANPNRIASQFIRVVDIQPIENEDLVYCFTEYKNHTGLFNCVATGQCGEQFLAESGVCDLASMNLTQFIHKDPNNGHIFDFNKFEKYIPIVVRLLDNVNSVSNSPLPEYKISMEHKRRIGVGILGWGSILFMLKIRFGSIEANALRDKIMETLATKCYESSIDLAIEKGMFSMCDPIKHSEGKFIQNLHLSQEYMDKLRTTGIRNSSLLSCQPTGNTSIFANIVSGGIEPIFMPEYIRTVIVNEMPDAIREVCPKWFEGEWFETDMFKFTKEGDEEILKGVNNGITYKIDKNRGLTKEVVCEDYGVRWLKENDEYDPDASYIVTTTELSADDHLNDLKGFARWVDSALSKTINLPNDYSFEDFKNVYLDTYKTGFIKGITTYRAGTMTTVLSSKDDCEEEIILDDVKMPDSASATIKTIKAEGKKWYLTIVYHSDSDKPFALFVKTNSIEKTVNANNAIEVLVNLATKKGIPPQHIDTTISKINQDTNASKITRIISLMLRHGVLIKNIVLALDTIEDVFVGSFLFQIKKFLSSYVKDGEKVEGAKCENCGSDKIEFSEGCFKCVECGSSKCG